MKMVNYEMEKLYPLMRKIDEECCKALEPQFSGYNTRPIGSQWDYDAAIAQARLDFKRFICESGSIDEAFNKASENLKKYVEKKNERYKKDYMLVRDINHGQDKLRSDLQRYKMDYFNISIDNLEEKDLDFLMKVVYVHTLAGRNKKRALEIYAKLNDIKSSLGDNK